MPSASVTFTGNLGPAVAVTSKLFTGISKFEYDLAKNVLQITDSNGIVTALDMNGRTTLTDTITSGNHAITIS